ncbi:hypothetical protein E3C22_13215 [Jiella endophytica]|uniref:Bromoperoxidase n=1 Tax=Jiella endophytica TaxID=2558362 RepID=A0A4Y8RG12_9HYPH|nr:hypothetical protein [Jiella endophytica]TFF21649.1 hypothetical protein E3C22_13215 [Jiella endophytica]
MNYQKPIPQPDGEGRDTQAPARRGAALALAQSLPKLKPASNGEAEDYAGIWPTNFSKGLPHDEFGIVEPIAFRIFAEALAGQSPHDHVPMAAMSHDAMEGMIRGMAVEMAQSALQSLRGGSAAGAPNWQTVPTKTRPLDFNVPLGPAAYQPQPNYSEPQNPADVAGPKGHYWPKSYVEALQASASSFAFVADYRCRFRKSLDGNFAEPAARGWESPRAGHTYVLRGPDPSDTAMAPAPRLGKSELCAELAEVYAMALLRDVPFDGSNSIGEGDGVSPNGVRVQNIVDALGKLSWFNAMGAPVSSFPERLEQGWTLTPEEMRRRYARFFDAGAVPPSNDGQRPVLAPILPSTAFRGSTPGSKAGPYISQFLLQGNASRVGEGRYKPKHGFIEYGAQRVCQKVDSHERGRDHMTHWDCWLDVQNGANFKGADLFGGEPRFITTPRDLVTFVHFDQLYQAYLNAGLLLLALDYPLGTGFPSGKNHPTRGSFATFGPGDVLSLVAGVASEALRAVRRQKFQVHLRARPEAIAGLLTLHGNGESPRLGQTAQAGLEAMLKELKKTNAGGLSLLDLIAEHNSTQNQSLKRSPAGSNDGTAAAGELKIRLPAHDSPFASKLDDASGNPGKNYLLPMAYPEGSPMHASYGAGHATVAGACVTVLKAFFEMFHDPRPDGPERNPLDPSYWPFPSGEKLAQDDRFWTPRTLWDAGMKEVLIGNGDTLQEVDKPEWNADKLTVQGELNKLASNISIGRNWAGVHYYSDYYDSLRLGERVAVGILREQLLTYPEPVTMHFNGYDGERIVLSSTGDPAARDATVTIYEKKNASWSSCDFAKWWVKNLPPEWVS